MKIIDLLSLIYEKKAPKKILYKYCEYEFDEEINDYVNNDNLKLFMYLFEYETDALFKEVEIIEDKPKEISEITLKGKTIGYGSMRNWLDFLPEGNERKICSAIEKNAMTINEIAKAVNYLLKKEGI